MMRADETPIFGNAVEGVEHTLRLAAYVVLADTYGRIAAVKDGEYYYLPGGGSLFRETPERTAIREVREELAHDLSIVRKLGTAVQYFVAGAVHFRMEATFFQGELLKATGSIAEHDWTWCEPHYLKPLLRHECYNWAIGQCQKR